MKTKSDPPKKCAERQRDPVGLVQRHEKEVCGQLRCWDRLVMAGTWVAFAHTGALLTVMEAKGVKVEGFKEFVREHTAGLREHLEALAKRHGVPVRFVRPRERKEALVAAVLKERGSHPGLVAVLTATEKGRTFGVRLMRCPGREPVPVLKEQSGLCLHYYFYWMHQQLGLIYVRIQTWLPCRVQVWLNGHSWLERRLLAEKVAHRMEDNALVECADWARAQAVADSLCAADLHPLLNKLMAEALPGLWSGPRSIHWSIWQAEYAHDIVFKNAAALRPVYEELCRRAVLEVQAADVARFLHRRAQAAAADNCASSWQGFETLRDMTRLKHRLGPAALKMYDKHGRILRVECTTLDVSFFRHHREVEHRDGSTSRRIAPMKKGLHSMGDLGGIMEAACRRYLEFLSALADTSAGERRMEKLAAPLRDRQSRSVPALNLLRREDVRFISSMVQGKGMLQGLTARALQRLWPKKKRGWISRRLRSLRLRGLLRRIRKTYVYHLTVLGRSVLSAALHVREAILRPALAA